MKNFFIDKSLERKLTLFCPLHILCMLFLVIGIVIIILNRNKIKNISPKKKEKIRIFIVVLLFLNMTIYYLSKIIYGVYDWKVHLPLHFCFIAGYMFMYSLLFKKWNLYKISYFMSFIGPIPAIIWPDIYRTFDCFIFYQYIISHHVFLLSTIFILYAYDQTITKKDIKKTFITILIIFLTMAIFNNMFDTNYIFSNKLPTQILEFYPFIQKFNYPVILVFLSGSILLFVAYLIPYFKNKEDNKYKF